MTMSSRNKAVERMRAEYEAARRRAPMTYLIFDEVNRCLYSEMVWRLKPAAVRELESLEIVLGMMKGRGQDLCPDDAAYIRDRLEQIKNDVVDEEKEEIPR